MPAKVTSSECDNGRLVAVGWLDLDKLKVAVRRIATHRGCNITLSIHLG